MKAKSIYAEIDLEINQLIQSVEIGRFEFSIIDLSSKINCKLLPKVTVCYILNPREVFDVNKKIATKYKILFNEDLIGQFLYMKLLKLD